MAMAVHLSLAMNGFAVVLGLHAAAARPVCGSC
jgi:hypothetical protein